MHIVASQGVLISLRSDADQFGKRAMIRRGQTGQDLPTNQFEFWRDVKMTFNPEEMRIK